MLYEILILSDTDYTWQHYSTHPVPDGPGAVIDGVTTKRYQALAVPDLLLSGWEPISSGYGQTIFRRLWRNEPIINQGPLIVQLGLCQHCIEQTYHDVYGRCLTCGER